MRAAVRTLLLGAAALPCSALLAAETPDDADADPQGTVVVTGQREKTGETGAKTDTPLIELPQTVTVIDNEELTRRNALSINQALTYVAGVTPNQRGNVATRYDQLFLRGFSPDTYLDGMRLRGGVYSTPQIDFHLVERVDVVKGPASVLYGSSTPGGLVNLSSKLPYAEFGGRIEIAAGSYDLLRSSVDVNAPLSDAWRFRVIAGGETSDGFVDFTRNGRYYAQPMLQFAPDDRTSVTLLLNYTRDPQAASYSAVPAYGSALPNPLGEIDVDFNPSEPAYERFDREQKSATLLFRRDLSDALTVAASARYFDVDLSYRQIYYSDFATTGTGANRNTDFGTLTRGVGGADEEAETVTVDAHLVGKFDTGPLRHTLLAGVDWQNNEYANFQEFRFGATGAGNLSLFDPVYGVGIPDFPLTQTNQDVKRDQVGLYIQDQIALGRLQLIASGRWDWYDQTTRNLVARSVTRLQQNAFTGRLGALYETSFGLAPFVSYSESFEPQSGATLAGTGTPFAPVTGRQYEAGVKFQPRGTSALFTLSAFDLRRQNVPVADPRSGTTVDGVVIPPNSQVQIGEVAVRGVELDGRGELFPGFDLVAAASYTDPEVTQGTALGAAGPISGVTGTRPLGVPTWGASGFVSYDLARTRMTGPVSGLSVGGGVRYVGDSDGTASTVRNGAPVLTRFRTPGYTLVDAVIGYDLSKFAGWGRGVSLQVNASNLLNKRHVASCFFNNWCFFGASRTVVGTIRATW